MEHFIKSLLLLSRAHYIALEGVLLGSLLDLFISDAFGELGGVARALELFT